MANLGIRFTFKSRESGGARDLERRMAGLERGAHVLQLAGPDGGLIASLAGDVGRGGRAAVVATTQAAANAFARAAGKAHVRVEIRVAPLDALPYDDADFDLDVRCQTN